MQKSLSPAPTGSRIPMETITSAGDANEGQSVGMIAPIDSLSNEPP
jgi:hypothetical protein